MHPILTHFCPAALTTSASPTTSSVYDFVSTLSVIEKLVQRGFSILSAKQVGWSPYAPHQVNLVPNSAPSVGDSFVMVSILNSHNGRTRLRLSGGLYRLVCSNGLTYDIAETISVKRIHRGHRAFDFDSALEIAMKQCDLLVAFHARAQHRVLTKREQLEVVLQALRAKHPGVNEFDEPEVFLTVRRQEDAGDDAWSVMNRVQENLFIGVKRRGVSNIFTQRAINNALLRTTMALVS